MGELEKEHGKLTEYEIEGPRAFNRILNAEPKPELDRKTKKQIQRGFKRLRRRSRENLVGRLASRIAKFLEA